MTFTIQPRWKSLGVGLSAIALSVVIPLGHPTARASTIAQVPKAELQSLQSGQVVLTGQGGRYTGRFLVNASMETAWNVLTDYNRYKDFLPDTPSSKVLQRKGDQTLFEQTNVVKVLVFTRTSRVVIAATAQYPSQITFRLVEGDSIKSLNGSWRLDPVGPNQVLVTQQVTVEPEEHIPYNTFTRLYKSSMSKTLLALKKETERRSKP